MPRTESWIECGLMSSSRTVLLVLLVSVNWASGGLELDEVEFVMVLCYSYRACFYSQYISQQMHPIKHSSRQVSNSYLFRHRSAILRESTWTKEYKPSR